VSRSSASPRRRRVSSTPWFAESERAGYGFVRRLADEWASGANRFGRPGEALFAARMMGA